MNKMKVLIAINIVLLVLLFIIVIKEKYIQKFETKFLKKVVLPSYSDRDEYKQELSLYDYYQKEGKVVMLGNSITYRCNWNELLNRSDIINRGISSDVTAGFLNRVKSVIQAKPEICFILGGINDLINGVDRQHINSNLNQLMLVLKEQNIKPILHSILFVADEFPNSKKLNEEISKTNELLKETCASIDVTYADLNNILNNQGVLSQENSIDGIHLTGLAYAKWGNYIEQIIENELNIP